MNPIKIVILSLLTFTIVACGGGGSPLQDIDTDTEEVEGVSESDITFLPLSILETSQEYSLLDKSDVFITESFYPFIYSDLISTFDVSTLEAKEATVDDFIITEDGEVIDDDESFPILQKVGAIPTYLHTAIVIDASNSVDENVLNEVVTETKALITLLQGSDDSVIANQRFTIWTFAGKVKEMTSGFTEDKTVLDAALDAILDPDLVDEISSSSSLNQAIVAAIGRFDGVGDNSGGIEYIYRDSDANGDNNDLIEGVSTTRIQLSSLIVVTSGTDTVRVFSDSQVTTAIESQSQEVFSTDTSSTEITENFGKPFIAVIVGDNDKTLQPSITDNASNIIDLRNKPAGSLSFAASTATYQSNLIATRKREGNRYFLRYASPLRQGSHELKTTTGAVDINYSLTSSIEFDVFQDVGMPAEEYYPNIVSSVEITTVNNEYLQSVVNINNTNVFYPATRWTNAVFASTDYSWALEGVALIPDSATGAITISPSVITDRSTLSLTNNAISETKSIQLTALDSSILVAFDGLTGFPLNDQTIASDDLGYIDLNADVEVDDEVVVDPEYVFQVYYEDYNVPLESYSYSISLPGLTAQDLNDDTAAYDYSFISSGIQIKKTSIDDLLGSLVITVRNTTLTTEAVFTITL
jgi:hypothetical protein